MNWCDAGGLMLAKWKTYETDKAMKRDGVTRDTIKERMIGIE